MARSSMRSVDFGNGETYTVKNTFIQFPDDSPQVNGLPLRRTFSGSDLASGSSGATLQELKEWASNSTPPNSDSGYPSKKEEASHSLLFESSESTSSHNTLDQSLTKDKEPEHASLEERHRSPPGLDSTDVQVVQEHGSPPTPEAVALYQALLTMSPKRNMNQEMMARFDQDMLHRYVPLNAQGEQTTIGSIMHFQPPVGQTCRPCLFYYQEQCKRGALCLYCHFTSHRSTLQCKRIRPSKSTRQRRAQQLIANDEPAPKYEPGPSRISL